MDSRKKLQGTIFMLLASICFSLGGLLIKLIPWNPLAINGIRNLIAAMVIGIYLLVTHHRLKWNFTVFCGAFCMFGVTTLYAIANKLTSAGNTIILQYSAPIWIIVFMYLFFRKKPGKAEIAAVLVVLTGILCFFFESLSTGKWLGDLLALLSGIFYAGVFMLNSFQNGDAISSVFFGQLLSAVLLGHLVRFETNFSFPTLAAVFLLGSVQVGLAYIFFTTGTRYTDPVAASIINAIEPILNPILVAIFYGEMLGSLSVIGAVIVICGILVYSLLQLREKRQPAKQGNRTIKAE